MHRNGPPGTFVRLGGVRISLPTDQIVAVEQARGAVTVAFGGMRFIGVEQGRLTFVRVRDLWPEERLSPDRSWKMTLETHWVTSVHENGCQAWPSLCASCTHARAIPSSHGSVFTLCQLSSIDARFSRYPTLPVLACPGYETSPAAGIAPDPKPVAP